MRLLLNFIFAIFAISAHAQVTDVVSGSKTPGFYSTRNYLKNPNCFANTKNISVTATGVIARNTTTPLQSPADCSLSGTSSGDKVTFAGSAFEPALKGQNCEVKFIYAGDASKWKAYAASSGTAVSQTLQLESTIDSLSVTQSKTASILFPCGDASTAIDLVFEATASTPLTFKTTSLYSGIATNMASVAQAVKVGSVKISGCSVNPNTASSTFAALGNGTGCTATATGDVSVHTSGSNIAGLRIQNRRLGSYKFEAHGSFGKTTSTTNANVEFVFRDTTNSLNADTTNTLTTVSAGGEASTMGYIGGSFNYTTSGDTLYEIYGRTSVSTSSTVAAIFINGDPSSANTRNLVIDVYYYPPASSIVQSPSQGDFDWIAFTPTGGWTTNAVYSGKYRRKGGHAEIQFKVSASSSVTGSSLCFNMPGSLTIDSSKLELTNGIAALPSSGIAWDASAAAGWPMYGEYQGTATQVCAMTQGTSSTYATRATVSTTLPFATAASDTYHLTVTVPIVGWTDTNLITGSLVDAVNSHGTGTGADIQAVHFGAAASCNTPCTTGTCYICHQVGSKITSVTWNGSAGRYAINGLNGLKYECQGSGWNGASTVPMMDYWFNSTSSYKSTIFSTAATEQNVSYASIICFGKP